MAGVGPEFPSAEAMSAAARRMYPCPPCDATGSVRVLVHADPTRRVCSACGGSGIDYPRMLRADGRLV